MARHARRNSSEAFDARFTEPNHRPRNPQGKHGRNETSRLSRVQGGDPSKTARIDRAATRQSPAPSAADRRQSSQQPPDLSGFDVQLSGQDIPGYDEAASRQQAIRGRNHQTARTREVARTAQQGEALRYEERDVQPTSRWQSVPESRVFRNSDQGGHGGGRHRAGSRGSDRGRAVHGHGPAAFESAPVRRRHHKALWIAGILIAALLAAYLIFAFMLDSRLAMNSSSSQQDLDQVLVDAGLNEPFYALILGSDSREGSGTSTRADETGANERADVMMLARVDAAKRQVTLVSIPRDTPYWLDSGDVVKINETYNMGGAAASIKAVSEITGVPISHYAEVHFSDVQAIVDLLGGVTVDVPIPLSYTDALTGQQVTLNPGKQKLDGQQAQIFARARHEYGDAQDAKRQEAVRSLLQAMMKSVLSQPAAELPGAVLDVSEHVGTDIRTGDLLALAAAYGFGGGDFTLYSCTGPTDGDLDVYGNGLWFCYDNPEGWSRLMAAVDAGEDPSGIDPNG